MSRNRGLALLQTVPRGARRRYKRYRTHSLLVDHPVAGRVVNVGQLGLAVESPEKLFVGGSYIFRVRLGSKRMSIPGKIRWCRLTSTEAEAPDETRPVFQAGVSFDETATSKAWQEALRRMTEGQTYLIWHRARTAER